MIYLNKNSCVNEVSPLIDMEYTTSSASASIEVAPFDEYTVTLNIGDQIFTKKDIKELISFLKVLRKTLPKDTQCDQD